MLLTSLNISLIKTFFSPIYYERGYDYYRENRVHNLNIAYDTNNKGDLIFAQVSGQNAFPYEVKIHLSGSPNKLEIHGVCSCPMQINCKHVVATLLKALDQASSPLFISATTQRHMNEKCAAVPLFPTPITNAETIISYKPPSMTMSDQKEIDEFQNSPRNSKVNFWLQRLNNALMQEKVIEHAVDKTFSLHYLLCATHNPNEIQLKLVLARRLKSGRLSAPKPFTDTAYSQQKHLFSVDKELLIKLEVAKKFTPGLYYAHYVIKGFAFEKLLPELIATGRCHWEMPSHPPLALAHTETVEFLWHIDENGFQELRPTFSDALGAFIVFQIDHLWYLNKSTSKLGLLKTGLDPQIAALLLSAPKIPPESTKDVINLLMKDIRFASIARPKVFTKIKIEQLRPIVCLHLFQAPITIKGDYRNHWQPIQTINPVAKLTFKYQGTEVSWADKSDLIHQIKDEQFTRLIRDKKVENDAIARLIKYGLTIIETTQELNLKENFPIAHCFLIGYGRHNPLDFSAHALPVLRANGWKVEIDPDYPYQIVDEPIDNWYSDIDEGSGYDWFNLELGIILNGQKINLLPILQQLLANSQQLEDSRDEPVLAQLPDGRFIPLPIKRVKNILNVLVELYDSKSLSDEKFLRLSKLHALRLLELEAALGAAQLRWFGGEKLRKLGAKLGQFTGIKAVKLPKQFHGQLRPYQLDGLNWLQFLREYELGGILADDMGLGKTVQTLSHLLVEKVSGRMKTPSLIIAPTSLMFNWRMEAKRFVPNLNVLVLHGSDRKEHFENISNYDLVFTTYALLSHDKEILLKQEFYFLILDEAQFIKNTNSLSAQIVQQLRAKHRLCLTGTPLENHLGELWSLFHFMMPGLLGDEQVFNRLFRTPIEKHGNLERRDHLNRRLSPFLLRRTKNKVIKELPEKIHVIRHVEIDGAQRDLYETIRMAMQKKVKQEIAKLGLARSHIIILDALLKLRQVCCDPRLLKINTAQKVKAKSAKLDLLMTLLPKLLEEKRRILLFSQFTGMLELIENELNMKKLTYVKLTGQTKDRSTPVQQFQNGEAPLFLISLKAGGVGLNLTAADTVIHYDPWWNPAVEDQATDRAHRIGQHNTVFVYKLVTKGTVEEKILEMQENKRGLIEGLFSVNTAAKTLKLTEKDLQGLFKPLGVMA